MKETEQRQKIKAVILAAGIGSRIRPLTDNCPKSLLTIGSKTILERMISHIDGTGAVDEIILVLGYLSSQIKEHVEAISPHVKVSFVTNDKYATTNTGFSLMLAENFIAGSSFIKFDADVVFDGEILKRLIECEDGNYLCVDKNINTAAEEIKVVIGSQNKVLRVSKIVNPKDAAGESIGIEKIDSETTPHLFAELRWAMRDQINHQEYYEASYERLIIRGTTFRALDITGLKWTEIDTEEDFMAAKGNFVV